MPIDGFFEWKAILGEKTKQPFAIAMKSGEPFALAAIWDEWRDSRMGTTRRTFAVVTCEANAMMWEIHDRMPVILQPEGYARWLGEEPDPRDLMVPFPSDPMTMWPISTKVGSPPNDTPDNLDRTRPPASIGAGNLRISAAPPAAVGDRSRTPRRSRGMGGRARSAAGATRAAAARG